MAAVLLLLPAIHPLVAVAAGALVYGAVLVALKGISASEFAIFVKPSA